MADFSESKGFGTKQYPVHALETSGLFKRCEPMINAAQLRRKFLLGVPMVFQNGDQFTNEDLKGFIQDAANEVELMLNTTIDRTQFKQKAPFDYALYNSFIHTKTEHGPVVSVEGLTITSSDGQQIFKIPPEWIEAAHFDRAQINVIPILAAFGTNQVGGALTNGGFAYLIALHGVTWVPSYWQVDYTAGLTDCRGRIPVPVNRLIGVTAAIMILGEIAKNNIHTSVSLGQDGISQSSSNPGPMVYRTRIEELEKEQAMLVSKLKALFGRRYTLSNV